MRNQSVIHDTEEKNFWLRYGESLEQAFVALMQAHNPGSRVRINPAKEQDLTAPDLLCLSGRIADLKSQFTPFFSAGKYGLDPRYTFSFNTKDMDRYRQFYPDISIYIWVNWVQDTLTLRGREIKVRPYQAVYRIRLSELIDLADTEEMPLHYYQRRKPISKGFRAGLVDEKGNACASYLVDLRRYRPLFFFNHSDSVIC